MWVCYWQKATNITCGEAAFSALRDTVPRAMVDAKPRRIAKDRQLRQMPRPLLGPAPIENPHSSRFPSRSIQKGHDFLGTHGSCALTAWLVRDFVAGRSGKSCGRLACRAYLPLDAFLAEPGGCVSCISTFQRVHCEGNYLQQSALQLKRSIAH